MKKGQSILGILFFALLFGLCFQQNALNVEAKTRVIHKDITPKEAASSDLKVIKKVTKLAAHRWIQSYTMDSKYYYYIQMTSPYTGNLRITRVKYRGLGRYIKDSCISCCSCVVPSSSVFCVSLLTNSNPNFWNNFKSL